MSGEAAVLLPVRLETAFDELEDGSWRLRVLVVPDPVSVDQHDPTVRGEELDAVDRLWAACGGELDTEAGRAGFDGLARAYGGGRAAWLVRTFPAVPGPDGLVADRGAAVSRTRPRGGVIRGLPPEIELWAALTNGDRVRLDTLEVTPLALRVELDPEAEVAYDEMLFRPSWAAASNAGLTSDVVLSDFGYGPIGPADISVLYAIGVGDDDLSPLFAAHRDAGRLAITALGEATNTVTGAPAADLAADPRRGPGSPSQWWRATTPSRCPSCSRATRTHWARSPSHRRPTAGSRWDCRPQARRWSPRSGPRCGA